MQSCIVPLVLYTTGIITPHKTRRQLEAADSSLCCIYTKAEKNR